MVNKDPKNKFEGINNNTFLDPYNSVKCVKSLDTQKHMFVQSKKNLKNFLENFLINNLKKNKAFESFLVKIISSFKFKLFCTFFKPS